MQKENIIPDLIKINSFLNHKDDANRILGVNLLSSLGVVPKELIDCLMDNLHSSRMVKVDIINNKDFVVHIDIGCVCYSGHSSVINHMHKVKNLASFSYSCDNTVIPTSFKKIKGLKKLNCNYTPKNKGKEEEIFSIISELKDLEYLALTHQKFDYIPSSIGKLTQLKELHIGINDLTELPDSLSNLKQLKSLSINECYFEEVPSIIFKTNQLSRLDISKLPLKKLPKKIKKLKNLKELIIKRNNLEELSEEILHLEKLEFLDICHSNFLMNTPEIIFKMENLKRLKISKTQFPSEEISRLREKLGDGLEISN